MSDALSIDNGDSDSLRSPNPFSDVGGLRPPTPPGLDLLWDTEMGGAGGEEFKLEEPAKKRVQWRAQQYFLTYSQIEDWKAKDIYEELENNLSVLGFSIKRVIYSDEEHKDGGAHVHMMIMFSEAIYSTDPGLWDVFELHPNVKVVKGSKNADKVMAYIMKAGQYEDRGYRDAFLKGINGFIKKKADLEAYENHVQTVGLIKQPDTINLPWGEPFQMQWNAQARMRHIWIKAEPNAGKSLWTYNTFAGVSIFAPGLDERSRWEDYNNEHIILYDDVTPSLNEFIMVANVAPWKVKVPGHTRYHATYFKPNHVRIIIILTNNWPDYMFDEALRTRAYRYEMHGKYGENATFNQIN